MVKKIFVDTSAWYSAYVIDDQEHQESHELVLRPTGQLITTDFVIDELLTLLVVRGRRITAEILGRQFLAGQLADIVWVDENVFRAAWQVFDSFSDKNWSFTDCVSYAVMKRLDIKEALTLDDDFRQFGFVNVSP